MSAGPPKSIIVHASCVALGARGILLLGPSGAGKSGLALRLVHEGAALVADDRVLITRKAGTLTASAPAAIKGLLEVRGLGIVALPARSVRLALAVQLGHQGARLPEKEHWTPAGLKGAPALPLIRLDGRHACDTAKIALALRAFTKNLFRDTFVAK